MDTTLPWILRLSSIAGLVSIVISHSAYLGNVNTHFSWLRSSQPALILNDAESHIPSTASPRPSSDLSSAAGPLDSDAPDANLAEVRALASAALVQAPLSARALRIIGQASNPENASRFMEAAVATSKRESTAAWWLMRFNFEHKEYAEAARFADLVLRFQPTMAPYVVPILGRMAETERRSEVLDLLTANPPWRIAFFRQIGGAISDARTPLQLLLNLKNSDAPPSPEEVHFYLALLLNNKLYDLAYYTWLMFLPEEQLSTTGLLANAEFKFPLSGEAFDWALKGGEGVRIEIGTAPDNSKKPALHFRFIGGRAGDHSVSQTLTLSPGNYRMSGRQLGNLLGPRGLSWHVSCLDSPDSSPIALGPMLKGAVKWTPFEFPISVPKTGCPAQVITLSLDARSASERVVSGDIWLDNMDIRQSSAR